MVCQRCGSRDSETPLPADLVAVNPRLIDGDGDTVCPWCIGRAMGDIVDRTWNLAEIPTDALLREIHRRATR